MSAELKTSDEWVKETGVVIMDPDGWDRSNFDKSWAEPISKVEFDDRVQRSTIQLGVCRRAAKEAEATLMVHHYVLGAQHMLTSIEEALSMNQMLRKKQSWTLTELKYMLHQVPKLNEEQMIAGLMENMP